jgi:TonB family protein
LKATARILWPLAILAVAAHAQEPLKPVVYNEAEGDGSLELDREIKAAYGKEFTIREARQSEGYVEPSPLAGSLPSSALIGGQAVIGYVRVAYIVSAEGLVSHPVVLRTTDPRLDTVAMDAMKQWRFSPGKVDGAPVATTAAQEFNFGPIDVSNGFAVDHLFTYQNADVLLRRLPAKYEVAAYLDQLKAVAHNFFVGAARPETFQIVVVLRPGGAARVWFVSSRRPNDAKELEPLRRLLEGVPPVEVHDGPVVLTLAGRVAGGHGLPPPDDAATPPVPREWLEATHGLDPTPPVSSDEFLNAVLKGAK